MKSKIKLLAKCFASLAVVCLIGILVFAGMLFNRHSFQAWVSGKVVDTDGNPISGARIDLYDCDSDSIANNAFVFTDKDGSYQVNTPHIQYALDTSPSYRGMLAVSANGFVSTRGTGGKPIRKGDNTGRDFVLVRE